MTDSYINDQNIIELHLEGLKVKLKDLLSTEKFIEMDSQKYMIFTEGLTEQKWRDWVRVYSMELDSYVEILAIYYFLTKKNIQFDRFEKLILPKMVSEISVVFDSYLKFLKAKWEEDWVDEYINLMTDFRTLIKESFLFSITLPADSEVSIDIGDGFIGMNSNLSRKKPFKELREYTLNLLKSAMSKYRSGGGQHETLRILMPCAKNLKTKRQLTNFIKRFFPNLMDSDFTLEPKDMNRKMDITPIVRVKSEILDRKPLEM